MMTIAPVIPFFVQPFAPTGAPSPVDASRVPAPGLAPEQQLLQLQNVVSLLENLLMRLMSPSPNLGASGLEAAPQEVRPLLSGLQDSFGHSCCCCRHEKASRAAGRNEKPVKPRPEPDKDEPSTKAEPKTKAGRKTEAEPNTGSDKAPKAEKSGKVDSAKDAELAKKIDDYLRRKGSPAAGSGELFIKHGREKNVDPLLLLAIAGHETVYGTQGVGLNGMLGVGAYDDDPNNSTRDPKFAGVENQLKVGANTFDHWRRHFGASPSDPIEHQVRMVGQKWATDKNWHLGIMRHYEQIKREING